jgi:hypothetical protein
MAEVRTNLRLPEELYTQIKQLAEQELRSINAEMIVLLQAAVAQKQQAQRQAREHQGEEGDLLRNGA